MSMRSAYSGSMRSVAFILLSAADFTSFTAARNIPIEPSLFRESSVENAFSVGSGFLVVASPNIARKSACDGLPQGFAYHWGTPLLSAGSPLTVTHASVLRSADEAPAHMRYLPPVVRQRPNSVL